MRVYLKTDNAVKRHLTRREAQLSQGDNNMLKKYLPVLAIAVGVVYAANRVPSVRRLIG
ncbi:hypothetical protein TUM17378_21120 [Shewanella algae]|uniref:Uncharacterized protein n=1 Tax=Shewanella carassii TaxID=1987584 RepID=A0ABQ1SUI3_9GAMM|nr:hypothetical protein TUM17378_21120 [Shewanella algae]GGE65524.1 hypothetical protein GCM10011520_02860 [Shewanella carassii]